MWFVLLPLCSTLYTVIIRSNPEMSTQYHVNVFHNYLQTIDFIYAISILTDVIIEVAKLDIRYVQLKHKLRLL